MGYKRHKRHRKFMRRYAKMNFARATVEERTMFAWLQERDCLWEAQHVWGHSIMDNWHPISRICIEVDGDSHRCKAQMLKDKTRDEAMRMSGIRVLRVTNQEVRTGEAFCKASELLGYSWCHADFYRPIWGL